ncbi:DUF2752 domain-containing protein [Mucilaginibacter calamicampi]|uniref:DUF2752 domain-containing protein n=1 Tax=Mucilaginibacter calamicampi TaxID=1302352 RepID=A0ABW2YXF0_9SPHI
MVIVSAIINISRSQPLFISWLRDHLLPCPFKYFTGLDCPGCGFQRSVLALMQGNLSESFRLYPATIPLLLFIIYTLADRFFKLDTEKGLLKKSFFVIVGWLVLISYGFKLWHIAYDKSAALAVATI